MPRESKPWWRASSGTWVSRVDGKLHTLARGKANRAEAAARLKAILSAPPAPEGLSLGELARRFLEWCSANLAANTAAWYARHLGPFVASVGPGTPCSSVTALAFVGWIDSTTWGQSTRHGAITAAKRMFAWGVRYGGLAANPIAGVEKPGILRKEQIPTAAEIAELLDAASGCIGDYLAFLAETGCRSSEAHRLLTRHVDLAAGACTLPGKTSRKSKRPRVIYLTPAASEILSRRTAGLAPDRHVFVSNADTPWSKASAILVVRRIRRRLGLGPHVTAGGIRHWWITERLRAGVPIAHVAELAGHLSTTMIARHYGHLSDHGADLRRALERKAS